jgi:hypothetical protein
MAHVYILQHVHATPNGEEDVKLIGVYATEADAQAALPRLSQQPGFRDHPEGFEISRYELNMETNPEKRGVSIAARAISCSSSRSREFQPFRAHRAARWRMGGHPESKPLGGHPREIPAPSTPCPIPRSPALTKIESPRF